MSVTVVLVTFGVIFLAELPDKTVFASLVLGSRYRPAHVYVGVAAAFAVQVTLAVVAGRLLALAPHRIVDLVVALLFAGGAVVLLRHDPEDEEAATEDAAGDDPAGAGRGLWRVAGLSFTVVFLAEFGDLTQIATANLAARYNDPVAVWIGATAGLCTVGALAVAGGHGLLKVLPLRLISRLAAAAMLVLAAISVVEAIRA